MTTQLMANEPTIELSPRAKLEILGAILLALFLFALDQTVVGAALPRIVTDLNGNSLYTWAITIYLLTSTISGPVYGKLSDLFGRRPIILFAVSLFLVASVLCRTEPGDVAVRPVPRPAGPGRRRRLPGRARRRRGPVHAGRARQVRRLLRRRVRPVVAPGPGHRRDHHRHLRVALDLLRQRADRPHLARRSSVACCRRSGGRTPAATSTTSALPCSPAPSRRSSSG